MNLSSMTKRLYEESEYSSYEALAAECGTNKAFLMRMLNGTNSFITANRIFEELTEDISEEEFFAALELVRASRQAIWEKENCL